MDVTDASLRRRRPKTDHAHVADYDSSECENHLQEVFPKCRFSLTNKLPLRFPYKLRRMFRSVGYANDRQMINTLCLIISVFCIQYRPIYKGPSYSIAYNVFGYGSHAVYFAHIISPHRMHSVECGLLLQTS